MRGIIYESDDRRHTEVGGLAPVREEIGRHHSLVRGGGGRNARKKELENQRRQAGAGRRGWGGGASEGQPQGGGSEGQPQSEPADEDESRV